MPCKMRYKLHYHTTNTYRACDLLLGAEPCTSMFSAHPSPRKGTIVYWGPREGTLAYFPYAYEYMCLCQACPSRTWLLLVIEACKYRYNYT